MATYDDLIKKRGGVEHRQSKLAANSEAIERWQRKLFRAANELQKLAAQRKRLLRGSSDKLKYRGEAIIGCGGGSVEGDSLEGI